MATKNIMDRKTNLSATSNLYIGIDLHKKSWSVHLRTDISDHKSMTIPPQPQILEEYVNKSFSDYKTFITYEAGCCGFSAARYFLNLGWDVKVVNPGDVPRMDKHYYQKTDVNDCSNLSKQLQTDQLRGIYIPDEQQDFLKSLIRQRAEVTRQLRSIKTSIKSYLLYQGIELPNKFDNPNWSKEFMHWIETIPWTQPTGKLCLNNKLKIYHCIYSEYLQLANEIRAFCRKHYKKDYYLLKSIPGVGGYLASVVLRMDPAMQLYYRKHIGKNPKSIIFKIAHKLLNRMLAVIKHETKYELNKNDQNYKADQKTAQT